MRRGIVFTMDAVFALYISLLFMSTMLVLLETGRNYSDDSLALSRLSRDVYEVKRYVPDLMLPNENITFITTGSACNLYDSVGSAMILRYSDIQKKPWTSKSNVSMAYEKVCIGD